ncbi:hypothetical protein AAFF_G00310760 [Aldrovandia affinis]|uniref:Uncharacterized protein n=1 Tax=Aldrovandia affinis TaxID=143900 RepID=A0AAD7R801_9TELE|nr:hypothetical protein AAFF_G00310760 [Aldrovandia affinis]
MRHSPRPMLIDAIKCFIASGRGTAYLTWACVLPSGRAATSRLTGEKRREGRADWITAVRVHSPCAPTGTAA